MNMSIMGNIRTPKERKPPPEYTTADESYQGREEESNGPHQDSPPHPQSEDKMEKAAPAGQLVVREPDLWGIVSMIIHNFLWLPKSPLQGVW